MQSIMLLVMPIAAVCIGCVLMKTIKWVARVDEIIDTCIALQKAQDAYDSGVKH